MEHRSLLIGDRRAELYFPGGECNSILYLHGGLEETAACAQLIKDTGYALALLPDVNWNNELTPWSAPKIFQDGMDFGGRAPEYLQLLTNRIVPEVEMHLLKPTEHRGIAGYSLAGLFAVYALWESSLFDQAASMSGSIWYDGFLKYIQNKGPAVNPEKVYLSIGDREKKTRNQRMARNEECTCCLKNELEQYGVHTKFILHPGGHFNDIAWRIRQGVRWILE